MKSIAKMVLSGPAAMVATAMAGMPVAASAADTVAPKYKQAMACSGYYTVLHFYMDQKNPGADQTLEYKGYATDWLKLAASLRGADDDLEKDFDAKQVDADDLIRNESRAAELKQVQTYCMTNGVALFKWDQR